MMNSKNKYHRLIATFFLLVFFPTLFPINLLYASNNGPSAPEATGFESVNATDMVNLASGDMAYVLPLMDVGGMPISLSYHGGIPLDLESTWTGLGWNLNTGAINRGLNATPDDWNGGTSVDFIHYTDSEEIYSVNVGVGIGKAAEVGVGASWGSNKSLSGSVYASIGIGKASASASIDTNGNYSLGVGVGTGKKGEPSFGGGVSISGNVNGGKTTFGFGVGLRAANGLTIGCGVSLNGNGSAISGSLGYSNVSGQGAHQTGQSGAIGLSAGSFSSGDWDIQTEGWYVPIQLGIISFGFGKQKVTYNLTRAYGKQGYGILYTNNALENDSSADGSFNDYQNRYRYMDVYDQSLPISEKQFVGDFDAEREKLNFTYAGYDFYDVEATGVSGMMTPKILQNATIYGLGYQGTDPYSTDEGKLKIYNHNSSITTKTFGTGSENDIDFYFKGQFTQNRAINPLVPTNNSASSLEGLLSSRASVNNQRIKQGSYVEVFTNLQIKNEQANGLLSPIDPEGNGTTLQPLLRNKPQYKNDGIGGYKITAPDGKIYHFSQPVYHYEMVERNILKDPSQENVSEKRQYSSYATHWVLTAITGPDFVDVNNNNIADESDYGYWVRIDYGKWSEGYVWRNPTDKKLNDYNTNIDSKIGTKDFGTYQFGRKELYYLDKVVSPTHTAYFVKDLRYDSMGADLSYSFGTSIGNSGTLTGHNVNPYEGGFSYKSQAQLMLEKIVLVKNQQATVSKGDRNSPLRLNDQQIPDYSKGYTLGFHNGGGFYEEYGQPYININNESGVYDVKDFEGFNYDNAVKVVDLEYNYNLAVKDHTNNLSSPDSNKSAGSPGTFPCAKNPNAGKLCLKSVRFLGRNNYDYMPPYQFEYIGEYINSSSPYIKYPANAILQKTRTGISGINFLGLPQAYPINSEIPINDIKAKDEWGFLKDNIGQTDIAASAWTLNKIKTPTGTLINFEHEEDDYYTEAFSRRYWTDNFKINPVDLGEKILLQVENQDGLVGGLEVNDFRQYFSINDNVYLNLWICRKEQHTFDPLDTGTLKIDDRNTCVVTNVTQSRVEILVNKIPNTPTQIVVPPLNTTLTVMMGGTLWGNDTGLVTNAWFTKFKDDSGGSHVYYDLPFGSCPEIGSCGIGCPDHWTMKYKFLATRVPADQTGGGLRVKSITLKDELNNSYKTSYYYNVPGTGRRKTDSNYKSSGITSYSPVRGQKFVPYQSELPNPGVMYEYVTMVAEDLNGNNTGETRYRFYTLKPVLNIFDPNITMRDDDGTEIFKASVIDYPTWENGRRIQSKSIKLDVNTSLIGQFRSVEEFNNKGQLLSKVERNYLSGTALKNAGINRGSVSESFQSMKSVFTTDKEGNNQALKSRFLSISSKEEYTSVLKSITTTNMHGKTTETYSKTDPETGAFLVVETEKADGSKKRVERIPAYTKYPEMGSKTTNLNNKHMLTQEAMVITSYSKYDGLWNTASGMINTWNKDWSYRDNFGVEESPTLEKHKIWRKHKTFVFKKELFSDGTFGGEILKADNNYFDWNLGKPLTNNWKKTSEITRYNHFSIPLEVKDINANFASSKMADKQNKVIVSGNARYTEMYYSGAEYVESGNNFEGEIKGANFRTSEIAHTGKYSVKSTAIGDKVFEISGSSGDNDYYAKKDSYTQTFRPGKYKASFWVYLGQADCKSTVANNFGGKLIVNGNEIVPTDVVNAGCWTQLNFVFDIPVNNPNNSIVVQTANGIGPCLLGYYFDDFRVSPITSNITSYVYDEKTDELSYSLDANNMATAYKYDNAGRLIGTYVEDVDAPNGKRGGFKLINQYKQSYQSITSPSVNLPAKIDNCAIGTNN